MIYELFYYWTFLIPWVGKLSQQDMLAFDLERRNVIGFQVFSVGELNSIPLSKKKHTFLRAECFKGWECDALETLAFVFSITVLSNQTN